jgi:anaerobic ribonucleoside-triphosphate reductase activating protein
VSSLFRFTCHTVGTLEVPDEVSLIYSISGCPLRCPGCHSADLRDARRGIPLTLELLHDALERYRGLASCVCFLGGEWQPEALIERLDLARNQGFKTCLYTGRTTLPEGIRRHLDYLKLGPFVAALGGLDSPRTNQRFLDLRRDLDLTHRFQRRPAPDAERAA